MSKNLWTFLFFEPPLPLRFYFHSARSGSYHSSPVFVLKIKAKILNMGYLAHISVSVPPLDYILVIGQFAFFSFWVFLSLSPVFKLPKREALIGSGSQELVSLQVTS